MNFPLKEEKNFRYLETGGKTDNLLLLHGLFGALSNFEGIIKHFGEKYNVIIPIIPIYELPLRKISLKGFIDHIENFVEFKGLKKFNILGNSLGGHLALLYALNFPKKVKSVILTGSSGLYENSMGSSYPKRGNYEYIKEKTEKVFYDPKVATKELVDEIFSIVNNRNKAIRVIATAKSAIRNNLKEKLSSIKAPTLLIWGKQDNVTPPFVGEKFNELMTNSKLVFFDKCGHAPMMEHPEQFNNHLESFLAEIQENS